MARWLAWTGPFLGLDETIEKIGLNVDRVGLDVSGVVQDFRAEDGLMVQLESGVASFEEAMSSLGIVFGEGGPDLTSAAGSIREAADGLPLPWVSCGRRLKIYAVS